MLKVIDLQSDRIEATVDERIKEMTDSGLFVAPCFLCGQPTQIREGKRGLNFSCECGVQAFVRGKAQELLGQFIRYHLVEKTRRDYNAAKLAERTGAGSS